MNNWFLSNKDIPYTDLGRTERREIDNTWAYVGINSRIVTIIGETCENDAELSPGPNSAPQYRNHFVVTPHYTLLPLTPG